MKKLICLLMTICILTIFVSACSETDTPVGVWAVAYGEGEFDRIKFLDLKADGTGYIYMVATKFNWTGINKIKWSMSGDTVKYTIIENDKGYSADLPVTYTDKTTYSFKNGVLYANERAMQKLDF